jgi:hypothetical protein
MIPRQLAQMLYQGGTVLVHAEPDGKNPEGKTLPRPGVLRLSHNSWY